LTSSDIAEYASQQLRDSFELAYADDSPTSYSKILKSLTDTVVAKAEGVFLWVTLVVKDLKSGVEAYARDDELELRLDSLPQGIDDLYTAMFAKIPPKDVTSAVHYLETLSRALYYVGSMDLYEFSFIDEDPKISMERPFQIVSIEDRITACRKIKGRVLSRTRNLVEFINSDKFDGPNSINWISDEEDSSSSEPEGQSSKAFEIGQYPLLQTKVTFVHRTLQEYMEKEKRWKSIVQRADKNILVNPYLSLMGCTISECKTTQSGRKLSDKEPMDSDRLPNLNKIMNYAYLSEVDTNTSQSACLQSMAAHFSKQFSNWTEFWGLPFGWGCDLTCVTVQYRLKLYLEEAFEQNQVDKRNLTHLLSHCLTSQEDLDYEICKFLLKMGCQLGDTFQGHSASEFFIWSISYNFGSRDFLETFYDLLSQGLDPNLLIQHMSPQTFPENVRDIVNVNVARHKFPCRPLHFILRLGIVYRYVDLSFRIIKAFLEFGADLHAEDGDGNTVLDIASHWDSQFGKVFDLTPLVLRLQKEVELASRPKSEARPESFRGSILDLTDSWKDLRDVEVNDKLERLLSRLEAEGYKYNPHDRKVPRSPSVSGNPESDPWLLEEWS